MTRPTRADAGGGAYLDLQNLARFVLKGGTLLAAWDSRRATVDGGPAGPRRHRRPEEFLTRVDAIATRPAPMEDGVEFLPDSAASRTTRDSGTYHGVRVTMPTLWSCC